MDALPVFEDKCVKPSHTSHRLLGAGLFGAITTLTSALAEFAAVCAAALAQLSADLADGLFGFREAVNLVSIRSAEVLVHRVTLT